MKKTVSLVVIGLLLGWMGRLMADEVFHDYTSRMYAATGNSQQTQELVKVAYGNAGTETSADTMAALNAIQNEKMIEQQEKLVEQNAEIIALLKAERK